VTAPEIHPERTLWLLSIAHAVNHAQAVVLPLIFLAVIDEFGVGVGAITFVAAAGAIGSGLVQASFAVLTRHIPRRWLIGIGGVLFGSGSRRRGSRRRSSVRRHERRVEDRGIAPAPGRQRASPSSSAGRRGLRSRPHLGTRKTKPRRTVPHGGRRLASLGPVRLPAALIATPSSVGT
jgi:hypothetical protein